jgi:hypothetical protein
MRRGVSVEFIFQPRRQSGKHGAIRPGRSGWRHHSGTNFSNHSLPNLAVPGNLCQIKLVEGKPTRLQPLVVTGDAVLID